MGLFSKNDKKSGKRSFLEQMTTPYRNEKTKQKENEEAFKIFLKNGHPFDVIFPDKAVEYTGISFAQTANNTNRKLKTIVKPVEKGIIIKSGEADGSDMRLPWEIIVNVSTNKDGAIKLNLEKSFILLILGPPRIVENELRIGDVKKYRVKISKYLNKKAKGKKEEGWD